ncbi:D-alanyl-D-alanine carboxypeptidase family protein [Lysobacter capsici]|uniref:M15 family metallopeptidase n=1 Tax=Lysobacter capsici TaxID=435897 RepID=UPI0007165F07|nr:M15 family metallopeptidase [Lysobacter capsici]ALN88297.1 D-alanyl-D-alanine carboxypeptidase family protein [Lysobacter capsici]WND80187.1 M15 family metallopeptidase [Lysobacter capsici]WND85383.1 M15 family metallopeptidase [Lysobacter capsici]
MPNWPHQNDVDEFYGDPRGGDGQANATWVGKHIVKLQTPWALVTAWDFMPVRNIRVHEKCADSLSAVFARIWDAAGQQQQKINEWGMNLYAGGFNYRVMRGSSRLSMHSWGCAVDFDSARNAFGDKTPAFALIPPVLEAFDSEGWTWGGRWRKPDGMHWQAAHL